MEPRELGSKYYWCRVQEARDSLREHDGEAMAEWLYDEDPDFEVFPEDDDGTEPRWDEFWDAYDVEMKRHIGESDN